MGAPLKPNYTEAEMLEEFTTLAHESGFIPPNEWAFIDIIECFEHLIVVQQFERADA